MATIRVTSSKKRPTGPVRESKYSGAKSYMNWVFKPRLSNEKIILHSILDKYSEEYYSSIVQTMKRLITSLVRNHGYTDGPARYNTLKNYTIQLVEGRNPENPPYFSTSEVYNVPSKLGENFIKLIIDYLNNTDETLSPKYYQVIITILNINRMVDGLSQADFQSVIDKPLAIEEELLKSFETYVSEKLYPFKYDKTYVNLFEYRFHVSKNGPNGMPKAESAEMEALTLIEDKLFIPFSRVCEEIGVSYLPRYLIELGDRLRSSKTTSTVKNKQVKDTILRKIVKVPDSGFKTRLVAIADFWTQLVLLPVRKHVQVTIENLYGSNDFRKSHDDGVTAMANFQRKCLESQTIESHTLDAKHLKFYDISSWTDRFHRDLQKITMKYLFSSRLSEAWSQLVVHCEWYSPDLKRTVKYGQGQGMGTNGSFDIATLTDHLFINYLIDKQSTIAGIFPNNSCYGKVGDDLWIYDPDNLIPKFYEKINLPINFSKSKEFCKLGSLGEFCSRTFLNSVDCSRISPKIVNKSQDFRYIPQLLGLCSQRGIQLNATSFESLNNTVRGSDETYLDRLQDWIIGMLIIGEFEHGSYYQYLTTDYLRTGSWIVGDRSNAILDDIQTRTRLLLCYIIVTMLESFLEIEEKILELVCAMDEFSDEIVSLNDRDCNLFDLDNVISNGFISSLPTTKTLDGILSPKQIIVLGRYVEQYQLRNRYIDIDMVYPRTAQEQLDQVKEFAKIASRCCYSDGILRYDSKLVYNTSFKVVKVLRRCNEDFTKLYFNSSTEFRKVRRYVPDMLRLFAAMEKKIELSIFPSEQTSKE